MRVKRLVTSDTRRCQSLVFYSPYPIRLGIYYILVCASNPIIRLHLTLILQMLEVACDIRCSTGRGPMKV